jgi:cAMP-binding proteins - catabolite gene activator and regulatory subunit of cAMP-dependent protein kinases
MTSGEALLIIRRNDFLAQLSQDDYDSLNIEHNVITRGKNEYIYFEPEWHGKIYFVKDGYIKIGSIDDTGTEHIIDILQPGDVFGQFTLDNSQTLHKEFARAHKSDVALCAFTTHDFRTLLSNRPDLSIQFSKKIGQKFKKFENRILNLLQKNARTRLLYFLYTLVKAADSSSNSIEINNFLTHAEIAHMTGTSRQTVTTLVNRFEEEGILKMTNKKIHIPDIHLLEKQLNITPR